MELFNIIKLMFTNKNEQWKTVTRNDKSKNFFLINRFMAIQFPVQAQYVNRTGIDGASIVDMWKIVGTKFTKVPGWIFTKTKNSASNTKSDNSFKEYPKHLVDLYLSVNKIGMEDFKLLLKNHPEEMEKHFVRLEKITTNDEKPDGIK